MARKKSKKSNNKLNNSLLDIGYLNLYGGGGLVWNPFNFKDTFSKDNLGNMLKGGLAGTIGSTVGNIGGNLISGGLLSGVGNAIGTVGNTIGDVVSSVNPLLGAGFKAATGIFGGGVNALIGSKLNLKNINKILAANTVMNNLVVDSSSNDAIQLLFANLDFGIDFNLSYIGKDGLFSNKAKSKYNQLKQLQEAARNRAFTAYSNAIGSADFNLDLNLLANYSAYGGDKNQKEPWYYPFVQNLWGATYDTNGKYKGNKFTTNIKKGTFNGGIFTGAGVTGTFPIINDYSSMTFNEAFDKAYKNKEELFKYGEKYYNTKKETNPIREINNRFVGNSKNRAKLKSTDNYQYTVGPVDFYGLEAIPFTNKLTPFAFGGPLLTNGGIWSNGLQYINNGDTHENNIYEGVPVGVDNQGIPNLVEEGETIWNDYVFSNRLTVPDTVRKKYKLRGNKNMTFADASKKMAKESEERPNDPISRNGLLVAITRLLQELEIIRENMALRLNKKNKNKGNQFPYGGPTLDLISRELYNTVLDLPYKYELPAWGTYESKPKYPKYGVDYLNSGVKDNTNFDITQSPLGITTNKQIPNSNNYWNAFDNLNPNLKVSSTRKTNNIVKTTEDNENDSKGNKWDLTKLRFAPAVGALFGLSLNLLSKPDYSYADKVEKAANLVGDYTPVSYDPIGNYLQYKPFDINHHTTKLAALANAARRTIMNSSLPSKYALLLASDYNYGNLLGDLGIKASDTAWNRNKDTETYNRLTNIANAEMGLKAAMANQEALLKARSGRLSGITLAMNMRDNIDARRAASFNANLTNLFDNLGNIGIDAYNRADRDFYLRTVGANLPLSEYQRLYGKLAAKKEAKSRGYSDTEIAKIFANNGGYLTVKKGGKRG